MTMKFRKSLYKTIQLEQTFNEGFYFQTCKKEWKFHHIYKKWKPLVACSIPNEQQLWYYKRCVLAHGELYWCAQWKQLFLYTGGIVWYCGNVPMTNSSAQITFLYFVVFCMLCPCNVGDDTNYKNWDSLYINNSYYIKIKY